MKVLVVSGFLGAGKTTFIKALAQRTHRDFAIMENEYGEVAVDGGILQQDERTEKLNIWELTEGCICCSMKSDFATSVLTIANTVDPEFLIVEPTGVGMLSKVLENLAQIQYDRITLLSPVTILDRNSFDHYMTEFPEIYRDQLASAGTILVSKGESATPDELAALEAQLREINPTAELHTDHYSHLEDHWWQQLLCRGLTGELTPAADADIRLQNLGLTDISLETADQLLLFLHGVVSGVFGSICRAKGCLRAGNGWLRFDVADRLYSITGCEPIEQSRAVFIGSHLERSFLREALQQELRVGLAAIRRPERSRWQGKNTIPNFGSEGLLHKS